ncbi:MAG: HAD family hydrolase, partial [Lachnospiraceae bacterium]|nr:HAD family hydrolase [Lachnospiraceae bacterium]
AGMRELLAALKEKGIRLAVLSNKPHEESVKVVEALFGKGMFEVIQGQSPEIPIKPSPQGVFKILERLNEKGGEEILPENLLYLGDTGTDVLTGRGAGAFTIGVLWGFRKMEELVENGADVVIRHPMEALEYLKLGR